ncbi:MAG: hypothetical protein QF749_12460 [Verrucomicrobiota bacterium]|jgi:hypothetical protein|nr:hypothetical protein [Verrucomicrobiota bacterium]MDP6251335.1 hypothetical protein [Verrucomicrobiota bacterium]MDP7179096.1 hypothetical protein [Verrucomicrobiota bacterium]MDP7292064.1 hypothetical protein [Verrucomicrobiota bacterium]HJN82201.1 hypothetical protein [Verrucomicrobiota bacterium]
MCKKMIIGALLGGVILLLWQAVVHMALGIYDDAFVDLKDPVAMEKVISENVTTSGMIVMPHPDSGDKEAKTKADEERTIGFSLLGTVNLDGRHGFGTALGIQFGFNMLASAVLMFVMLVANPRTLGACLALSLCFAVFGVLVGVLPNWNWWGYSTAYVGGQIGELIVGWALVGLVLAKVMGNGTSSDD